MTVILSHHYGIEYLRNLRSIALLRPKKMGDWLAAPNRGLELLARGHINLANGRRTPETHETRCAPSPFLDAKECNEILENAKMPTRRELEDILEHVPLLANASAQRHVIVSNQDARHQSAHVRAHQLKARLWDGALWRITDDIYVCSPELLFAEMATILPRPKLVRLGLELCGGYSIQPDAAFGFDNVYAVTTPSKLIRCLDEMRKVPGKRQAMIAAVRIAANSASPAETDLYIILCFPRTEGGYGLPRPLLNGEVKIKLPNGEAFSRFCDLLWEKLAAEYLGGLSHTGQSPFLNDATRQGELAASGIQVIPITADHVASIPRLDRIAGTIEKGLGIHRRGVTQGYREKQLELHTMLYPWAH